MKKIMLDVKPFQMRPNSGFCGPASLKIVLSYYGLKKSEKKLAELCRTSNQLGTKNIRIKIAAERLGLTAVVKNNSNLRSIESWLKSGVPIIVNWFTTGRPEYADIDVPGGHYSVVTGIDDKFIYLQDPEIGKIRRIKRAEFMRVWFDFPGWLINREDLVVRQIIAIFPQDNKY